MFLDTIYSFLHTLSGFTSFYQTNVNRNSPEKYYLCNDGWALMPLVVFLCMYLVTSIIVNDFYKVPITVAFLTASIYAVATTKGLSLNDRILQYSSGAANTNIMLMIWIFILAGAFAQSAKAMGAIDATVNLTLHLHSQPKPWEPLTRLSI